METEDVIAEAIEAASIAFDEMVRARHEMGADKYGPTKFLEVDTVEMALEELADLANYTRYTFIKLYLLRAHLERLTQPLPQSGIGLAAVHNPLMKG